MARLSVNVDHVATLRQARGGIEPDPVLAALLAEMAGADSIIVHLREDRRHIQDRDLRLIKETIKTRLNMEMAATEEIIRIAIETKPYLATLVPEKRQELTTEGGLEVYANKATLKKVIKRLKGEDIKISLFVDPIARQIEAAKEVGADLVEIHTGLYAEAKDDFKIASELKKIIDSVGIAKNLGLEIHAGHGLNYQNIKRLIHTPEIEEFSIGHSIISYSVFVGIERAVRDMISLIKGE